MDKLAEFAEKNGLTLGKKCCHGIYKGYFVHIKYSKMSSPSCLITIVTRAEERKGALETYLRKHIREFNISNFGVVGLGLMVSPKPKPDVFASAQIILDKVTAHLTREGYSGAQVCPYCAQPLNGNGINVSESDVPFLAHESCFDSAYAARLAKEKTEAATDKKPVATLAAFLGALLCAGLFLILYLWTNIGAIACLFSPVLAGYLYRKAGGRESNFKTVMCVILSFILSCAAFGLSFAVEAKLTEGGWTAIGELLKHDGVYLSLFIVNIVCLFGFTALGGFYVHLTRNKKDKTPSSQMRKLVEEEKENSEDK